MIIQRRVKEEGREDLQALWELYCETHRRCLFTNKIFYLNPTVPAEIVQLARSYEFGVMKPGELRTHIDGVVEQLSRFW